MTTCEKCRAYVPDTKHFGFGTCHLLPPSPVGSERLMGFKHPLVDCDDWCIHAVPIQPSIPVTVTVTDSQTNKE